MSTILIPSKTRKKSKTKTEKSQRALASVCLLFPSLPAPLLPSQVQPTTAARLNPPLPQPQPNACLVFPKQKGEREFVHAPDPARLPSRHPHMAALRLCEQLKKNDPCSCFSDPCADPRPCPDLATSYASLRVHRTCS
ncbi:hypothetical protein PR202_gb21474 [Eleusine coracana subsp. coracana]|uniref:Uncharacterized protein n=1 Tax=Eleusine coracana subsp. coracana TaxID=191504 RepID=A0AAV5FDB9_ELECO|nr:hypothetical protein PR202_gb21474 [Eleusine coracana subsp. coracana]